MRRFNLCFAIVITSVAAEPLMAQRLVGETKDWLIMRMDENECWMVAGSSSSLFALAINRSQEPSVLFSVKRETTPPTSIPVSIGLVNTPLADNPVRFQSQFSLVKRKGNEFFYQSKLSQDQFDMVASYKVVTFSEMLSSSMKYSRIAAANRMPHDARALNLLRECAVNL